MIDYSTSPVPMWTGYRLHARPQLSSTSLGGQTAWLTSMEFGR